MSLFNSATYFRSAHNWEDLPPDAGAELAFAGRSNAGKSSAINSITNQNKLAFISKTPGRTQQINYFALPNQRYLVDLPGYGYAGVPLELKAHWGDLLSAYLATRRSLVGLVIMMDSRHPLTELDQRMLAWFSPRQLPVRVLLTKSDKLSKNEATAALSKVRTSLSSEFPQASIQLFSSLNKQGVDEAEDWIAALFGMEARKRADSENKNPRLKGSKVGGEAKP
jgi:GTP-binding protein